MAQSTPDPHRIPGRLSVYDREEIRAASRAGVSVKQLCAEYRRKPATIRRIVRSTEAANG